VDLRKLEMGERKLSGFFRNAQREALNPARPTLLTWRKRLRMTKY
jgi:hypothetical protein